MQTAMLIKEERLLIPTKVYSANHKGQYLGFPFNWITGSCALLNIVREEGVDFSVSHSEEIKPQVGLQNKFLPPKIQGEHSGEMF